MLYRVCVLVPIGEEFLYRGLLLMVPSHRIRYVMLIISSIIFASIHSNPYETIWRSLESYGNLLVKGTFQIRKHFS
ncbi:CPBP family glutamic-type intramembrane protease [Rossellomorea vietnamensis]|uniref:CPBP family glutamic-type intramembrane protease n=1 Tax=Rossellomorea TaxID=2837508 RepID=UPI0016535016